MLSTNKVVHAEDTFFKHKIFSSGLSSDIYSNLQGLYVPSVKTTIYVCNRFNASFVLKTTKHTWLYRATYYCTRLQGVKERIAQGSVGIF